MFKLLQLMDNQEPLRIWDLKVSLLEKVKQGHLFDRCLGSSQSLRLLLQLKLYGKKTFKYLF